MNTTQTTTTEVRKILKAAGLAPAKTSTSSNVRKTHGMGGNYTSVTSQGFSLKSETTFGRVITNERTGEYVKRHTKTGRVEVSILTSAWHADEAKAQADVAVARTALEAAGLTVTNAHGPRTLLVSA